ncbi:unnamed protein product [Paramecium octaurelia]|uniref:Steroid 5-alpha reductase C-terminal domain-containing protein n=1 Tax=Paramecium octaurelia TaxID=43137 RepID=A0A8S1SID2_PAROT|nr:unnamed protein product [Paramecium octaurelia]CAD8139656.1 unnamed protein product [Paramecium octaurelia]CAD8139658.1 unnamed protein product [Paramecium octaurelia]
MIDFVEVALNWALPAILIDQILFFIIYKIAGDQICIVDVAYPTSHLVAGIIYCVFSDIPLPSKIISIILLVLWSMRLAGFIFIYRVLGGYKDERFENIFNEFNNERLKKNMMVMIQFLFQGIFIFVTSIPLYFLFQNNLTWKSENFQGLQVMNYIALSIIPFSICLEAIADIQLEQFKKLQQQDLIPKTEIMETGFWKKSRHPNLFFDLITWTCFGISAIYDGISVCSLIGPIILFCAMEFVTVPITEAHMKKKRGEAFDQYVLRTNKFLIF